MDNQLVQQFIASPQGQQALAQLKAAGHSHADAQRYLGHAARAGHDHTHEHAKKHGLLGEHAGRNFFAAYAAGLVRGDGIFGALGDGAEGLIAGRITQIICVREGLDYNVASVVAAVSAPFVITFLKHHLHI